jgi:nucleoside-diphosphate-sugar epimerase
MKIAVAGATGKTGRHLVARLCADGHQVVAHGRDPARLAHLDRRAEGRLADFEDATALRAALAGAEIVVNCAEARFARAILGTLPSTCRRIIVTGTMRRFLAVPDEPGRFAADAETLIASCGRPGVVIHFGMIYGPPDDGNVERLLAILRRWPRRVPLFVPLPGGGRHTVQPIFMADAVEALARACLMDTAPGAPLVVAGSPITYAEMVRVAARAIGRRARIMRLPRAVLINGARLLEVLRIVPPLTGAEWARAGESKNVDTTEAAHRLGIAPRPFAAGLAEKLRTA